MRTTVRCQNSGKRRRKPENDPSWRRQRQVGNFRPDFNNIGAILCNSKKQVIWSRALVRWSLQYKEYQTANLRFYHRFEPIVQYIVMSAFRFHRRCARGGQRHDWLAAVGSPDGGRGHCRTMHRAVEGERIEA